MPFRSPRVWQQAGNQTGVEPPKFSKTCLVVRYDIKLQLFCPTQEIPAGNRKKVLGKIDKGCKNIRRVFTLDFQLPWLLPKISSLTWRCVTQQVMERMQWIQQQIFVSADCQLQKAQAQRTRFTETQVFRRKAEGGSWDRDRRAQNVVSLSVVCCLLVLGKRTLGCVK